jgi:hypothetical protein
MKGIRCGATELGVTPAKSHACYSKSSSSIVLLIPPNSLTIF